MNLSLVSGIQLWFIKHIIHTYRCDGLSSWPWSSHQVNPEDLCGRFKGGNGEDWRSIKICCLKWALPSYKDKSYNETIRKCTMWRLKTFVSQILRVKRSSSSVLCYFGLAFSSLIYKKENNWPVYQLSAYGQCRNNKHDQWIYDARSRISDSYRSYCFYMILREYLCPTYIKGSGKNKLA